MMRRRLILIAEDEPDTARLLEFHLRRHGYTTAVAPDGLTAVNTVFEKKPVLIILDLMLPLMHGFEVCRLVKSSPTGNQIPIIMLTAMASTENKLEGFKQGADDYVTKPFVMSELIARVEALLQRAQTEA